MPLPDSIDALRARHLAGERFDYTCFWGHRSRADGAIGNACFSQWYPAAFTLDGVDYRSAEHAMMAGKARLFGDALALQRILHTDTPDAAKALGRGVAGFDAAVWDAHRFDIVVRANLAKFGQDAALAAHLRASGQTVLVEASPVDPVWGIGLAADDPRAADPACWRGLNLLGFALMHVRARLVEAEG